MAGGCRSVADRFRPPASGIAPPLPGSGGNGIVPPDFACREGISPLAGRIHAQVPHHPQRHDPPEIPLDESTSRLTIKTVATIDPSYSLTVQEILDEERVQKMLAITAHHEVS